MPVFDMVIHVNASKEQVDLRDNLYKHERKRL